LRISFKFEPSCLEGKRNGKGVGEVRPQEKEKGKVKIRGGEEGNDIAHHYASYHVPLKYILPLFEKRREEGVSSTRREKEGRSRRSSEDSHQLVQAAESQ